LSSSSRRVVVIVVDDKYYIVDRIIVSISFTFCRKSLTSIF
jgi:hypothetical protein